MATEDELKQVDKDVKARMKEVIDFAENSEFPDPSELYEDVYMGDYPFIKE
jgi:pyruvate dehydrogenase E1 component alpha subunit